MVHRTASLKSAERQSVWQHYRLDAFLICLTILWDSFSVALAYVTAYQWRALAPNTLFSLDFYWRLAQFSGVSTLAVFAVLGLYRLPGYQSRFDETVKAFLGVTVAFTLVLAGAFFFREASFSRIVVASAWVTAAFTIVLGRLLLQELNRRLRQRGFGLRRVLVIGTGHSALGLGELLAKNSQWGLQLAGYVSETEDPQAVAQLSTLGQYLQQNPVSEVWFALPDWPRRELLSLLQVVTATGHSQVRLVPDILEFVTAQMRVDTFGGTALLTLQETPLRLWYNRVLKRVLDIVLAGGGLIVAMPLLAVIAALVKLTSTGSIFYSQERIGRDGEVFGIHKFRTMRTDAEAQGPGWTTKDDPRRTPVGGFLRRSSLDELPQLWNVLVGQMSLVGPRPERPVYVERFSQDIPKYFDRHLVKTGITGWAQIHGLRGDTSIPERVRYDLYYIENWSLLLDIRIVLVTVWQVIFTTGDAY
jgi:putative colanic acid biosysnthesis UDP-glucose lipid carrier transferase